MIILLFFIMWFSAAISIIPNIAPYTKELSTWQQLLVSAIIIIGAPFMLVTQAIELILDIFLAEGWNGDDDDKFGY